ncbi:heavy metal translocating P-type ATPase [Clostridioides difficile]|uniref:heavy metal translocating P-type ATPase n=1 Tax=Clostridioides difficile TaxID=1496 RepID=UPI00202E960B|nr:heavy metal translocating P-type ATPase [Clostridioides difficile]MCB4304407.1 cadmium-translocating P-type ATPase [Clostridioides difficile]MCM0739259.1 cadmium-translocating P-type ATPase [Clostridioides difficile]MCM0743234.1 cadmium-translocating P-type ATPase [Clostridioides difficile]MCM0747051.1 cadmium-translocating P-type ATPase [Clostridioides difficile]MCP8365350.1 heavy metal translocating P-type ATPase [Clostridioides difficile]
MSKKLKNLRLRIFLSFIVFLGAILIPMEKPIQLVFYLASYLIVGGDIIKKAVTNIGHGQVFDENFLMVLATIGAFATQEYPEAVMVMWLYQIGEWFQQYAVGKSRQSISDLMDIRPDYANVERDGKLEKVDPDDVSIGDHIVVKPGEKIPLDGIVIKGNSLVDTSALTGESVPREVKKGTDILSGCINKTGLLTIKVTKEFDDSTVSKILELVENASSKKAKAENFITKFARYYTPIVVIAAVCLAFLPPLFLENADVWDYIKRACSFLVISCPCALVISVPLGFFGGIGGASKLGILVKGSNYLETLSKTETIVFDKTGTLTKGSFEVTEISPIGIDKASLLEIAAHAENYSDHPIAQSIKKAYGKTIDTSRIADASEVSGNGVCVKIDGKEVYAGNEKLMKKIKVKMPAMNIVGTVIHVAMENQYVGYILIADEVKEEAKQTIHDLKETNHVKETVMLTGDNSVVAESVGKSLAIDTVYSQLLPADKVTKVEELLQRKSSDKSLAFVGDGINDAPVLTRADVGIAMGGLGSDAAIEAADVVIMDDKISKINTAIYISKRTLKIVKQNIIFALGVKGVVLIFGAIGMANMWEAVFADVGVSFIAILNSMRALRVNKFND